MSASAPVVTRFAPSPTGYLHIGGARTALFNYLFAKATGGQFRLRVEDTDVARSTEDAKEAILNGMKWLGLAHDGEIIYQSQRADRHAEIAQELIANGSAYKCFLCADEATSLKEEARAQKKQLRSPWRDKSAEEHPKGQEYVVRLKVPDRDGAYDITLEDKVQGNVKISTDQIDDFVILRSDGTPTYMLAVVVDDYDMGVTHIIRGDDHLLNSFKQYLIFNGMGWDFPVIAHIPLIHGADGAKLSKRHGALGVEEYRAMGFLPQALRNYLLRLGWSHGDDEIISDAQAAEWFNLEHINKAAARFDFDKLDNLNGHYIRECDDAFLIEDVTPRLTFLLGSAPDAAILQQAMPHLKERAKRMEDLAEAALFFFRSENPPADDKAAKQLEEGRALMQQFIPALEDFSGSWDHEALFPFAKEWAEAKGEKIGKLMSPIRVALTGSTGSPSIAAVMEILGKNETLKRLKNA